MTAHAEVARLPPIEDTAGGGGWKGTKPPSGCHGEGIGGGGLGTCWCCCWLCCMMRELASGLDLRALSCRGCWAVAEGLKSPLMGWRGLPSTPVEAKLGVGGVGRPDLLPGTGVVGVGYAVLLALRGCRDGLPLKLSVVW